jgi:hypothetical protein
MSRDVHVSLNSSMTQFYEGVAHARLTMYHIRVRWPCSAEAYGAKTRTKAYKLTLYKHARGLIEAAKSVAETRHQRHGACWNGAMMRRVQRDLSVYINQCPNFCGIEINGMQKMQTIQQQGIIIF